MRPVSLDPAIRRILCVRRVAPLMNHVIERDPNA
jgi:hypothetical protein